MLIKPPTWFKNPIINNMISLFRTAVNNSTYANASADLMQQSFCYCIGTSSSPFFNGAFVSNIYDKIKLQYFPDIINYFSHKKLPFILWLASNSPISDVNNKQLMQFGFLPQPANLGIEINIDDINYFDMPRKIKIKEVAFDSEYQQFINIFKEVFQMTDAAILDFSSVYKSYGADNKLRHYLGYYDDEPVAILTGYLCDSVMGL